MLELLRIEWMKIRHYRAFWVFTILYFISIAGINYIGYYFNTLAEKNVPISKMLIGSPYAYPKIWGTVGFMSSWLLYFPGILFIMLLVNEFNFKTHRQNIIDGWERKEFVTVKFFSAFVFSLIATLFNVLVAVLFGSVIVGSPFTLEGTEDILYIFLQTFSYITFAMFLAILFRRSGVAMAVFFLYGLIFEWLITAWLNFNLKITPVGYFLPLQVTDTLLPFPFGKEVIYKGAPAPWILIIADLIFLSAYYFFARKKFTSDDL